MGAWVLGRLRGRRGRALIAALAVVAVVAPIGIGRLVEEWNARSAPIVIVVKEGQVDAHGPPTRRDSRDSFSGDESFSECGPDRFPWWPRFNFDVAAWSPESSEIYSTDRGDLQGVTSDASRLWLVAKSVPGTFYAVAPDGMQLVYTDCRPETVTGPDGTTRVLPDQTGLELLLLRRGGGGIEQLTANVAVDFYPAWSPDGKRIAFLLNAGAERLGMGMKTMAADGTDVQRLLDEEFAVLPSRRSGRPTAATWPLSVISPIGE